MKHQKVTDDILKCIKVISRRFAIKIDRLIIADFLDLHGEFNLFFM